MDKLCILLKILAESHYALDLGDKIALPKGAVIIYGWGGRCKSENRAHSKFAPPRKPCTEITPPLEVCQPCVYISRYDVSQWSL